MACKAAFISSWAASGRGVLGAHNTSQASLSFGQSCHRCLGPRQHRCATIVMAEYEPSEAEPRWQRFWDENGTYKTPERPDEQRPKFYALDMFPYPSGAGLHVGHPEGYTATDIVSRYKRHKGFNVLHPMGWDAFGLPAEQYAVQTGTHPAVTTRKNIDRFRAQLQALGLSYDWSREVSTTEPRYYKWTQWIFLQLYNRGLAYQAEVPVNWCPALGTVLANEEVIDGRSERGDFPVERRPMRQWMLRITEYAERLLQDLDTLDWPENIKTMQREWIGRSEGAEVAFTAQDGREVRVFTTRPDTICGVSYVCIAPEYENIEAFASAEQLEAVRNYVNDATFRSDRERTGEGATTKTGVWTGTYVKNSANGEEVPLWVADYVLSGYGTGAVMAVPAHDQRDFDFAKTFDLPIKRVIVGGEDENTGAFEGHGPICNWNGAFGLDLDGVDSREGKSRLRCFFKNSDAGTWKVNYKLRDWLFARQRYWGEPFPIIYVDGEPKAVAENELPLELPEVESYQPSGTGASPLANISSWVEVQDPQSGRAARRETNTMPQWAGSCWYYLRFIDPHNDKLLVDKALERFWMPVDLYVGGVEHAVLHLLYARFWHKVLYDCGVVSTPEPFQRLVNQGMILGEVEYTAFQDESGAFVSAKHVDEDNSTLKRTGESVQRVTVDVKDLVKKGDAFFLRDHPSIKVNSRAHKMSKSRGNVINPDDIISKHGADALRCYLMFMGPLEQVKPWNTAGVQGILRFFQRVYRLFTKDDSHELSDQIQDDVTPSKEQLAEINKCMKLVTQQTEDMRFNTALSSMMEFVNAAYKWRGPIARSILEPLPVLLSPYAPHLAEELWRLLGHNESIAYVPWPEYNEDFLAVEKVQYMLLINGKQRGRVAADVDLDRSRAEEVAREALSIENGTMNGKPIKKVIFVPNKLVNFVL